MLKAKKENNVKETWRKKNGLIQRERPAGRESPQQVDGLTQHRSDRRDTVMHMLPLLQPDPGNHHPERAFQALVNN